MASQALWDTVSALSNKIRTAASTATPEELAYLGSAMEKIGGHVSLADLADHVQTVKGEIQDHLDETMRVFDSDATLLKNNMSSEVSGMFSGLEAQVLALILSQKTELTIAATAAQTQMSQYATQKVAEVTDAINALIGPATSALNASVSGAGAVVDEIRTAAVMTEEDLLFFGSF